VRQKGFYPITGELKMQFTTRAKVLGMKMFNDTLEGKTYDFTKLFVESELDESRGVAKGFTAVEYDFSTSAEFQKMKHLSFPFVADLTIELVTTGKTSKQRVLAMKPVQPTLGQQNPAAK
jgi:hypothetical protein